MCAYENGLLCSGLALLSAALLCLISWTCLVVLTVGSTVSVCDLPSDKDALVTAVPPPSGQPFPQAQDMMQNYLPGQLENSTKMMVFKVLLEETVKLGDKMLLFSQSLFTLNIIEEFLQQTVIPGRSEKWMLNQSYYRLDGSTTGLEREKLISEFNANPAVPLFLVSTRAGSLGVNLVGANRVLVFDASWNPCHDTQAVCRVYRFGQQKPCFLYRLVTDNCLERRIYDRQLKKQSMSNRIVDETNPDNMVTTQSLNRLLDPTEDDPPPATVAADPEKVSDPVLLTALNKLGHLFSQVSRAPLHAIAVLSRV